MSLTVTKEESYFFFRCSSVFTCVNGVSRMIFAVYRSQCVWLILLRLIEFILSGRADFLSPGTYFKWINMSDHFQPIFDCVSLGEYQRNDWGRTHVTDQCRKEYFAVVIRVKVAGLFRCKMDFTFLQNRNDDFSVNDSCRSRIHCVFDVNFETDIRIREVQWIIWIQLKYDWRWQSYACRRFGKCNNSAQLK